MRAKPNLSEPREVLQELLNHPPHISQAELRECVLLHDVYELSRAEFEPVRDHLGEMLKAGFPIEPGAWTAELQGTQIAIRAVDIE